MRCIECYVKQAIDVQMLDVLDQSNTWRCPLCGYVRKYGGRAVKEVRVTPLFDGEMYEIWFPLAGNSRGYFKASIQPIIDVIKAKVPITAREYNPDSKHWTLAKESYIPIIEVMKSMGFKVTVQATAKQNAPNVEVPKDYEENFYRSASAASAGAESYTSVREQLFTILEVQLESTAPADLKS